MQDISIKVFVGVENRLLRDALLSLLGKEKDINVVGHAGNCYEATQQLLSNRTDVLLLNPASATLSDVAALRRDHSAAQELKIVLFGMEEDEKLFLEAVRQRVVGYVLKNASAPEVVAAVRAVARGEAVCPPRLCLLLVNCVANQGTALMPALRLHVELGLTRRERELLPMIARGLTNKEIAAQLSVSEQTIKNHIHRMIEKAEQEPVSTSWSGVDNRSWRFEGTKCYGYFSSVLVPIK